MRKKQIKTHATHVSRVDVVEWLRVVQSLIGKHSTEPRTRGKRKGHASTDALVWVAELALLCRAHIARRNKGHTYDENMAMASMLGLILCAWYAQVHRAKGMDPNRPLSRRKVFARLVKWRAQLLSATTDERVMGAVWGRQQWNFPFGKGARGGKFV